MPLTYTTMTSWAWLMRERPTPAEVRLLRQLDSILRNVGGTSDAKVDIPPGARRMRDPGTPWPERK